MDDYGFELSVSRENAAAILRALGDGVAAGSVRLGEDGLVADVPAWLDVEVEYESDDAVELEVELTWYNETGADAIVSLGGGSSLDTATVASVLAASDRSREDRYEEFAALGTVQIPEDGLVPIVAVPTTLAGADLSMVAGISAHPDTDPVEERVGGGVSDPRLMPDGLFYDPELFATTPTGVLFASAMNGFDKGLETIYARDATPITDATASHGLSLFADGLTGLGEDPEDHEALRDAVQGTILVQYGISRPDASTLSLIHAFGHALTAHYEVQQGAAHAVVAPHVLRYLFDRVDARRDLLADAFGVAGEGQTPDERAEAVVDAVREVRAALDLPTRLRDVEGASRADFADLAEYTLNDGFTGNGPEGVEHSVESLTDVLEAAW